MQGVHVFTLNQSFSYIYVGGKVLRFPLKILYQIYMQQMFDFNSLKNSVTCY